MVLPTGKLICISTHAEFIRSFMSNMPTSREMITCFRCGENGHYRSECFNYKTRFCWHFANDICKDPNCSFAHSEEELRTPWLPRCIRIVKRDGILITLGCRGFHTYKYCPYKNRSLECTNAE